MLPGTKQVKQNIWSETKVVCYLSYRETIPTAETSPRPAIDAIGEKRENKDAHAAPSCAAGGCGP